MGEARATVLGCEESPSGLVDMPGFQVVTSQVGATVDGRITYPSSATWITLKS
jgi:hypothetical protein